MNRLILLLALLGAATAFDPATWTRVDAFGSNDCWKGLKNETKQRANWWNINVSRHYGLVVILYRAAPSPRNPILGSVGILMELRKTPPRAIGLTANGFVKQGLYCECSLLCDLGTVIIFK